MAKGKETEIVKINTALTGRGGKYNFPNAIPPEDENDVRQALTSVMQWYEIGKTKPASPEEWEQRTDFFFTDCINNGQRPTWEKYCLCMGYTRQMIWDMMNEKRNASPAIVNTIKKAKEYCAAYDAEMVNQGKLNPVPYIFRAKNYYGMKDTQDVVLTPNNPISDIPPEEVAEKYQELPD